MNTLPLAVAPAVEEFLSAQAGEVSESTRVWYRDRLRDFASFAGELGVCQVDARMLRAYRADLLDRKMTEHTVHGYQRALRRFFGWMVEERMIDRNVARDVPLIRLPAQPPKGVTDEDLNRLLARLPAESPRDRAIVLFLVETGCRIGGLCSLTLESVDLANRLAMVVEKGRRARRVYFTEYTAEALRLYLLVRPAVESDALWIAEKGGRPLASAGVQQVLERIAKRAGVKGRYNAHAFRHAFARTFLKKGGNLATLARLLGHSPGSPVTARYYGVFDDGELQEFHSRFSPLAGGGRD